MGSAESLWRFQIDGNEVGPITVAEAAMRIRSGEITADTMACKEGMGLWRKASDFPTLREKLEDEAPPPIPPPILSQTVPRPATLDDIHRELVVIRKSVGCLLTVIVVLAILGFLGEILSRTPPTHSPAPSSMWR